MSAPSLQSVEEQLRSIISSYTQDDWEQQGGTLMRIRELTVKPRKGAASRPRKGPAKTSAKSLDDLLHLPDDGQHPTDENPSNSDAFEDEQSVIRYCRNDGLGPKAVAVVKAVYRSLEHSEDIYTDIWQGLRHFYKAKGSTASRLLDTQDVVVDEADVNAARYRINALLFAFEYRARCEKLLFDNSKSTKNKETAVLRMIMEESGKTSDQIHTLLKRGRFYAQWVNELGVGAILVLGQSLASSIYMTSIDHLIRTCKAIPGFSERSRNLSQPARKAIVQAIILSGQTASVTAQRYIDHSGVTALSTTHQDRNITSGLARQTLNNPSLIQGITEQPPELRPMPALFSMPEASAVPQHGRDIQNLHPQWQADSVLTRQQETAARTATLGHSPNANTSAHVILPDTGEAHSAPAEGANRTGSNSFSSNQFYDNVSVGGPAWNGTPYNTQSEGWDVGFWGTNFSL